MPSTTMLPTYRYMQIFCFFIVLRDDTYTNVFIFIRKIIYAVPLQGSYLLGFCSYLTLKIYILILDDLYLIFKVGNYCNFSSIACRCISWIFSILESNPSGTMSFRVCLLTSSPISFREFKIT